MALMIPCPTCGRRPFTEFVCGGELPEHETAGSEAGSDPLEADFQRVWHRRNVAGPQVERWFHTAGCRRWVTLTRNTLTNEIQ
jgi:heterotetrameric sarcosine oxidase delta subunit